MTEEEYFRKNYPDSCYGDRPLSPYWDYFQDGVEFGERQSEGKIKHLEESLLDVTKKSVKRIEELEKENTKLKSYCVTCVYTDSPCVLSDYPSKNGVCSHYKNVFVENAELKYELEEIKKRILPQDMCELMAEVKENYDNKVKAEQLTKASEHIRTLISCLIDWVQEGDKYYCYIADAEQFLKE